MIFVKYFLLNFLYLFNNTVDIFSVGLFSVLSWTLSFISEIKEDNKVNNFLIFIYCIFIYFVPESRFFVFSLLYAVYKTDYRNFPIFCVFLFFGEYGYFVISLLVIFFSISEKKLLEILKNRDLEFLNFHKDKFNLKENLKNLHFEEERKKHRLILEEREKISKNLHNSIGHTLSASILELHALSLTCEDEEMKESIENLRENLSVGMKEIREIIHNMYNSSIDLEEEILKIIEVSDKKTNLIYRINSTLSSNFSFDILNVVKESFTNFLKYSNGDTFNVKFVEHDKIYVLTIWDNGKNVVINEGGLGLLSIKQIAEKHFGNFNLITENGFKINIIFNKE